MRTMTPWDSNMWDGCREKNDIWDWPDYSLQQLRGPFREKISSMGEFTDNRPHIPMNGFGRMEMDLCFSSVQLLSCVQLFAIPWTAAHQVSLSIASFWSLLKLMFIESVMPSNYHILCCPLLLLPSIFPSIRVFPMSQFFASSGQSIGISPEVKYEDKVTCQSYLKKKKPEIYTLLRFPYSTTYPFTPAGWSKFIFIYLFKAMRTVGSY